MKKWLALVLALVLCFCMTACLDDMPTKEDASPNGGEEAGEEQVFGLNETAVFKTLKFTATEIKESKGEDYFKPEAGKVFVGVNFTIENVSDEEQAVSTLLLFEGYADDVKCDYSLSAACVFDEGTLDGELAPGKKLVGWYALEVPENWNTIELNVQSDWLSDSSAKFVFNK